MLRKFNLHFNFESSIYSKLNKLKPCQVPFILQQFVQGQVVDFTYLLELLHRLPYTDVLLYRNHLGAVWRMNICYCIGYHSFAKNIGHASRICVSVAIYLWLWNFYEGIYIDFVTLKTTITDITISHKFHGNFILHNNIMKEIWDIIIASTRYLFL